ncbi:hypothetical protein KIL84_005678 [Mauremys mutica]|uniref:Uncharacterized protein n=1 Tax=Mauremys mutica TaxID=74926 RepID=A0A9D3XGT0_9SAUR|nr:hypothetical protein KIL84_005678 [Mauremys mutica]
MSVSPIGGWFPAEGNGGGAAVRVLRTVASPRVFCYWEPGLALTNCAETSVPSTTPLPFTALTPWKPSPRAAKQPSDIQGPGRPAQNGPVFRESSPLSSEKLFRGEIKSPKIFQGPGGGKANLLLDLVGQL